MLSPLLQFRCVFYAVRGSGAAQQSSSQQPTATIKVQAREVLLPVMVIDKHNQFVTNLTAKDFTLTEDGRPQTIKSFTSESNLPFRLGLLVDTSRGVYPAMDSERKAAGEVRRPDAPRGPKAGVQATTRPSSFTSTARWNCLGLHQLAR